MKKSNFIALVLGTISGVLFALGMCMAMITVWNAFRPGIILGIAGIVLALITVFVWRRMEHKTPVHLSAKNVFAVMVGVVGALALGAGMCFSMVWGQMLIGIVIGLAGIIVMLSLIPIVKGIK